MPTDVNIPAPDEPTSDTPTVAITKKDIPAQPDWHLFHALQATRSSLPELDRLARSPPPSQDPAAELRAIEAQVMGPVRSDSVTVRAGEGRTPAASSPRL